MARTYRPERVWILRIADRNVSGHTIRVALARKQTETQRHPPKAIGDAQRRSDALEFLEDTGLARSSGGLI